jgi:hypothetical protein
VHKPSSFLFSAEAAGFSSAITSLVSIEEALTTESESATSFTSFKLSSAVHLRSSDFILDSTCLLSMTSSSIDSSPELRSKFSFSGEPTSRLSFLYESTLSVVSMSYKDGRLLTSSFSSSRGCKSPPKEALLQ